MLITLELTEEELREIYGYDLNEHEKLPGAYYAAQYCREQLLRIADRKNR